MVAHVLYCRGTFHMVLHMVVYMYFTLFFLQVLYLRYFSYVLMNENGTFC